jgi:hypothetical protein
MKQLYVFSITHHTNFTNNNQRYLNKSNKNAFKPPNNNRSGYRERGSGPGRPEVRELRKQLIF